MKYNSILKNAFYLLFASVFLFTLNACGQNSTSTPPTTNASPTSDAMFAENPSQPSDSSSAQTSDDAPSANNDALAAYQNFLAGSINAQDFKHEISDGTVTIKDISLDSDLKTYYALFDMNGDEIPELHLRPAVGGSYAIFTYLDGQIVLWHDGPDYESPLNNGAILYQRDGAAPTHINYYYLVLDSNGNEISKVYFSKYHSVDESTDYDEFLFEDKEVSQDEWNSLTNQYLSNSSDLIIWNCLTEISKTVEQVIPMPSEEQKINDIEITLNVYNMNKEAIYSEKIKTQKTNLLEIMNNDDALKMKTEDSEDGKFIVSIMDISYDYGQYWNCYINGESLLENISLYDVHDNDVVDLRYEKIGE